jgi:carbon monoxide dehydrogenase subunit G/alkylhydroperoxidase family enzyme
LELTGERTLPVSRDIAWHALNDTESLKSAVPGCESLTASGENAFDVAVNAAIGPVKARFKGRLELADVQAPESYSLRFDMQGGAAGFSRGDARVKLEAIDANTTRMTYAVNASIGGKIAQLAPRRCRRRDDGRPVLHDLCGGSRGQVSDGPRRARGSGDEGTRFLRDALGIPEAAVRRPLMRLPAWTQGLAPRDRELVASIEARRGGTLLNLDRMLLWSEPLARGWNGYLRAIRTELALSPFLRELAICVVARLTGAQYEYHHHAPELKQAGATDAQLAVLDDPDVAATSPLYDELQRAVIRFAIASTREVKIPDRLFDELKQRLPPNELVELVAATATYNMVARFLVALEIVPES